VEEGAVVENCIILQNIKIKANAKLHNVIVDKNVTISENTELRGNENFPLVIEKKNLL
jgi:glucose-1-phosphate adenylyltransferase